ncbi:hypothetical protein P153DRAFT_198360 [Dothidotthia symphoricarpi CBS 119687]|uniref:DUF7603 domain-containing protein n=1 Tax=Dothidotthia symphoricarpi CBS 119687 TaxID=1392245 RepID=A0A6A6AL09_9PLEO|nr:uncharacterized protein P153DRAFT_198360 [Dothidotthia symphoricarpi CBS 119687]KAF2131557.1 hypothetical protein P153DRAFT_198360 [Dothidotthia symphoricarpi CBS 119687]
MHKYKDPVEGPTRSGSPPPRPNPFTLASFAIQSFASFRSQTPPLPASAAGHSHSQSQSPVRRKPLPANSLVSNRFSAPQAQPTFRSSVVQDTESHQSDSGRRPLANLSPPLDDANFLPRNLDDNPHGNTPLKGTASKSTFAPRKSSLSITTTPIPSAPRHERSASSFQPRRTNRTEELRSQGGRPLHTRSPTMPNMPVYTSDPRQPDLRLRLDGVTEVIIDEDTYRLDEDVAREQTSSSKPKSPGGGFTSFFGWNASKSQNGADSPATTFSERTKPEGLDIPAAQSYFNVPGTPLFSSSPQMNAHVEELERELREISSELASSIQREMDLEDEVERWKAESSTTAPSDNRRTSDYFSDSGTSSVRFPIGDPEAKLEEVETLRRKAEQDRASLKVRMAERIQEELRRRRDLEEQVQHLEEQVSDKSRAGSFSESPRLRELTTSLEDAKRRLAEERQVKENFEDLLTALRDELEKHRNEADELRDQIVPQLRARLEVLEVEAVDTERLVHETTRMQQEIEHLRTENQALNNTRKLQLEMPQQNLPFQPIAEEANDSPTTTLRVGLSRSNSLARSTGAFKSMRLSRSNSVKDKSGEASPREQAPVAGNPVKELEEQRDALHKALKHLLQRQEMQQKEFERRIRELEAERDVALNVTPRRTAFHKEVSDLRQEVDSLRRRADDALEQKYQCEKGLGGLRMDLDRAQQETSSLRDLLHEHEIAIPEIRLENEPISLDKAYNELRTTHALSIASIQQLESSDGDSLGAAGVEAQRTLDLLKQSISDAEAERDLAQEEAEYYREQARELQKSEIEHLGKEQKLSIELFAAATRMDELSNRIQQQLQANSSLRNRLTEAITRGEKEQQKSTEQIIELERRLKTAEDKVMFAQQSSEDAIAKHEEEVQTLKESHSDHLRRVKSGLLSPAAFSPKMPLSPVFAQRSPRLDVTSSGPAMTMAEATKTELLQKRVEELEKALRDADREMEEVVGRMNFAQIEVAELQFERDEALRSTRKLQAEITSEREKVKVLMNSTS